LNARLYVMYIPLRAREGRYVVERTIARLNIEHFQKLLAKETDQTKRQTLVELIADEKAKLAALKDPKKQKDRA